MASNFQISLLTNVTTVGGGTWVNIAQVAQMRKTVAATLTGTGTLSATIEVEASMDGINAIGTLLGTITLSNSDPTDGFAFDASWPFILMNVTAISGTSATLNGKMRV